MSNPMIREHNIETGEIIDREMNAKELKQYELDQKVVQDNLLSETQTAADKAALLAKLGITADEAKLLLA